jgi:hypothetical protein
MLAQMLDMFCSLFILGLVAFGLLLVIGLICQLFESKKHKATEEQKTYDDLYKELVLWD